MSVHVFLGPTLTRTEAAQHLDATYHPPVQQGDVLRVLQDDPSTILIVDGYFMFVPAVWHKEILYALERGVRVFGASSMGALRAAELAEFGMVGVGRVFQWFASGALEDDDEVAIAHAGPDAGFRPQSEALVNVRDLCQRAVRRQTITRRSADAIVDTAKRMYYADRNWPAIFDGARQTGVDDAALQAVDRIGRSTRTVKERDAIAALRLLARLKGRRRRSDRPTVRAERTVFLMSLQHEVETRPGAAWQEQPGGALDVARKKVLLGILAGRELERSGLRADDDEPDAHIVRWFNSAYDVPGGVARDVWLAARGVAQSDVDRALRRFSAVVRVQARLAEDIEREVPAFVRLHEAASTVDPGSEWTQINVALSRAGTSARQSARALFARLLPMVTTERRRLGIESFHFTRKAPDVRLRFLCGGNSDRLLARLRSVLGVRRGGVDGAFVSIYEPEVRLFGGDEAMRTVHRYFQHDSINAMRWLTQKPDGEGRTASALSYRVVDDLFARTVEGGSEVWDAWHNVLELGSPEEPAVSALPDLDTRVTSASDKRLLGAYRRVNARMSEEIGWLRQEGRLAVGVRALVAYLAMFHFNRYGLDGSRQAEIARVAIARRDPTFSEPSRARR